MDPVPASGTGAVVGIWRWPQTPVQRIVAGLLSLAGLLIGAVSIAGTVSDQSALRVLQKQGIPTSATIVGTRGPGGNTVIMTYRTRQGIKYTTTDLSPAGFHTAGRHILAVYDPADPTDVALASDLQNDNDLVDDLVGAVPIATFGIWQIIRTLHPLEPN